MSIVTEMRADRREEGKVEYERWETVDGGLIEQIVGRMDQRRHTETTLRGEDWWFVLLGGGAGSFVVSVENQMTGVRYQLINPHPQSSVPSEVVTGGQLGRFDPSLVVSSEDAVRAARHFASTGRPDPELRWIEEQSD